MKNDAKTPSGQLEDEILIARVAGGDQDALAVLYDRYAPIVLGICRKIIGNPAAAEELLQKTFWQVWKSAAMYQAQRGSFRSWLFRSARNLAVDAYRRQSIRPQEFARGPHTNPSPDQLPDPDGDVSEQAQINLRVQAVQQVLHTLSPEQREVIEMAYFFGMTRHEIAERTGNSLGTIHVRARLGLQKLKDALDRTSEFKR